MGAPEVGAPNQGIKGTKSKMSGDTVSVLSVHSGTIRRCPLTPNLVKRTYDSVATRLRIGEERISNYVDATTLFRGLRLLRDLRTPFQILELGVGAQGIQQRVFEVEIEIFLFVSLP
jgi:hypothetical protein